MTDQPNLKTPLLQPQEDVLVPAGAEPFVVRNQFKTASGVRFATVWDDFKTHFWGKVEDPRPEMRVRKYKLLTFAPDGPLIAELGGPGKVESTLGVTFALLQRQPGGQAGFLQTNGFANIFQASVSPHY